MINHDAAEFDSFKRMKVFGETYAADYTSAPASPAKTKAIALFGQNAVVVGRLKDLGAGQVSGAADFHVGTGSKAGLRARVMHVLSSSSRLRRCQSPRTTRAW